MSDLRITSVCWSEPRAVALRRLLNEEMTAVYTGRHDDDPDFAAKARVAFAVHSEAIVATLLAVDEHGAALGHAALRRLGPRLEVKNVVVSPAGRGEGVGRLLMGEVDATARALGAASVILQTGDRQPEAVALYEKLGYRRIPVYEPYRAITNSLCFEKQLAPASA